MEASRALSERLLLQERRLAQLDERERRDVRFSRVAMLLAGIIGELGLALSIGAAVWNHDWEVFPASISDMNAVNGPNSKIFTGLILAMALMLFASRWGLRILKATGVGERVLFDLAVPASIACVAVVPEIWTEGDGGNGAWIMTSVHSLAAAIVFVLAPLVLLAKSIPRPRQSPPPCCSLFEPNEVLSSSRDVLLRLGPRRELRYHWSYMAALQSLALVLFVVFFTYNEVYAGNSSKETERYHVVSFSVEVVLITSLFVTFVIITRLGREAGAEEEARRGEQLPPGAEAPAAAVTNGTGRTHASKTEPRPGPAGEDDEEKGAIPAQARAAARGAGAGFSNGSGGSNGGQTQEEQVESTGNKGVDWIRLFTNRVSIGE